MAKRSLGADAISVAIIIVAGLAVTRAVNILPFDWQAQGMTRLPFALAQSYQDEMGVRALARRFMAPEDLLTALPAASIKSVIKARPTAGYYWAALASHAFTHSNTRQLAHQALSMSTIVEPHELKTVSMRVAIELTNWEVLTLREQSIAIDELTSIGPRLAPDNLAKVKRAVRALDELQRADLKSRIADTGKLDARAIASFGF
jgi:hypothetical protein